MRHKAPSLLLALPLALCPAVMPLALPPAAAQSSPCPPDSALPRQEAQLLAEVNRLRAAQGLGPLTVSAPLGTAALHHACDTARLLRLSHTSPDGRTPGQRALQAGYRYEMIAENLGFGFTSAAEAVAGWMTSPGHRENLLRPEVSEIGLGLARAQDGRRAWVLMLAKPR